jgi:hypothetical protein
MTGKKGKAKANWVIVLRFTKKSNAKIVQDWLVREHKIPRYEIPIEKPEGDKDA